MTTMGRRQLALLLGICVLPLVYWCTLIHDTVRPLPLSNEERTTDESRTSVFVQTLEERTIAPSAAVDRVVRDFPLYLLPIYRCGAGPNNQYRSFNIAIRFAIHFNRTLVLAPFFDHTLIDQRAAKQVNETFDITSLNYIVPTASIGHFYQDCGGTIDTIVHGNPLIHKLADYEQYVAKYQQTRHRFRETTGIILPSLGTNPSSFMGNTAKFKNSKNIHCLAFYAPVTIDYELMDLTSYLTSNEYHTTGKLIHRHLKRATPILQIADRFESLLCRGDPYIVLHWRINDEFMKLRCHTLKSPECNLFQELNETGTFISEQLQKTMHLYRVNCIYVATPPDAWDLLIHMRTIIPNTFTFRDMINMSDTDLSFLYDDNYILSLVEQELAFRSVLFVGSRGSSWTSLVRMERRLRKVPTLFISEIHMNL